MNLLPLSNVRLEINESDAARENLIPERNYRQTKVVDRPKAESNPTIVSVSTKRSITDTEKCSKHCPAARITEIADETKDRGITSFTQIAREKSRYEDTFYAYDGNVDSSKKITTRAVVETCHSKTKEKDRQVDQENKQCTNKPRVEETEDTKSLWISDNEEIEEMSRRPQILKVIDNDITKLKNPKKCVSLDVKFAEDEVTPKENLPENTTSFKALRKPDIINDHIYESPGSIAENNNEPDKEKERISVENARSFFEKKSTDTEINRAEGRLERIVKETSSILGKACHAVKGSLGFEARSDSSDLGIGSEIGSDVRRLSVDENTNANDEQNTSRKQNMETDGHANFEVVEDKNQKNSTNLIRSRSCMDSMECQESDEPEFDHVRYKIVKSNMFGKNMFNNAKKDVTYDGLMQYLREYSFQDLLMDNNVVIIEPVRAEVERKPSFNNSTLKSTPSFKVEKIKTSDLKSTEEAEDSKLKNHFVKAPRQSSLRKHFFYQPIRVNRELNDEELPDPDTVKNVRRMFEESLKGKMNREGGKRKSVSMKDLRTLENHQEGPRYLFSS